MTRTATGTVITRDALTPELAAADDALFDLATRYLGLGVYEDEGFVPSEAELAVLAREVDAIRETVTGLDVPAALTPFAAHLEECVSWLATTVDDDRDFPVNPLRAWISAVQQRLFPLEPTRDPEGRARFLRTRLERADAYLTTLVDGAAHAPGSHLEHCLRRLAPLDVDLERGADAVRDLPDAASLRVALERARVAVARCRDRLRAAIDAPREVRLRCTYEDVVAHKFGFDLEAIRSWCDTDLAAVREHLSATIGGSGPEALEHVFETQLTRYPDVDALRRDAQAALQRARAVAAERVALPADERLVLDDVPDTDRDKLPFGAYSGGSVLRGDVTGRWLVNMANLRGVHRGWVWMMALHEGYPGHHVHYTKTAANDALPRTFRLPGYAPAQGLVEGVAHRSEAYLETLEDQRAVWPMVPYRRLQTLLRIKTQLMISVDRATLEEAVAVYTDSLGMDHATASALVRSQTMNPGRTYSYYTGMRSLREAQQRLGADDAAFTETIFANGFVSLATMEALLDARFGDS